MKRQNLIIVILTAFIAAILSIVVSNALFGSPQKNVIKVPQVQKISSTFPLPQTDNTYQAFFNQQALNPTQLIQIGGSSNTTPFQGGQGQ
jgi:hypothetical protein